MQISKNIFINKPNYLDVIFYFLILILCYFTFNHADILYPGGSSFVYLNGHIRDFYTVNKELMGGAAYFPSIYILYAIWNIPIKLFGIVTQATLNVGYVIFWYKLLTTLFFAGSACFLYKIGRVVGLKNTNSMLLTMIWISSPILFFGQFIFGQCDIITIFFVLVGLYYYLRKNTWLFILFFGISLTFKYFSLFLLVPLLLLVEKNPVKMIGYLALAFIPVGIESLFYFYYDSPAFVSEMIGYGFMNRIFISSINVFQSVNISILLLIWFIICGICYYLKPFKDNSDFYQTSFYVCLAACCNLFIFVMWHPQWLVFMTPFLAVTTFMSRRIKYFLLFDFLLMIAFVSFTVVFFQMNVDQTMFRLGILGKFNPNLGNPDKVLKMYYFFSLSRGSTLFLNIYRTLFSAILMLNVLFKFPGKWNTWKGDDKLVPVTGYWNYARLSFFGGIAIFIIPAFIAYFLTLIRA
jgi:hypothetical protein